MRTRAVPSLLTAGRIAAELGAPIRRVIYIIATRPHIGPAARAGTLRLFNRDVIPLIRHELNTIDARRAAREGVARAD